MTSTMVVAAEMIVVTIGSTMSRRDNAMMKTMILNDVLSFVVVASRLRSTSRTRAHDNASES